jgi:hypothetical protein
MLIDTEGGMIPWGLLGLTAVQYTLSDTKGRKDDGLASELQLSPLAVDKIA